jgi:hypothetical protein
MSAKSTNKSGKAHATNLNPQRIIKLGDGLDAALRRTALKDATERMQSIAEFPGPSTVDALFLRDLLMNYESEPTNGILWWVEYMCGV